MRSIRRQNHIPIISDLSHDHSESRHNQSKFAHTSLAKQSTIILNDRQLSLEWVINCALWNVRSETSHTHKPPSSHLTFVQWHCLMSARFFMGWQQNRPAWPSRSFWSCLSAVYRHNLLDLPTTQDDPYWTVTWAVDTAFEIIYVPPNGTALRTTRGWCRFD